MKNSLLAPVLNLIGVVALGLGILGIFLPLLPTTPFLLLASACFARGSTRMHNWLLNNKVFGKYIRDFEQGKGIPLKGKVVAVSMLWLSLGYAAYQASRLPLTLLLLAIGVGVSMYLTVFVPTREGP